MFASSSATPYVMEPLLDMMGLRKCQLYVFWGGHKTLGDSSGWVHFPVAGATKSSYLFDVPKCPCKCFLSSVGRVLIDDPVGTGVCI